MKRRTLFLTLFIICTTVFSLFFFRAQGDYPAKKSVLPTYFTYANSNLQPIFSTYLISDATLKKWDVALEEYFREKNAPPTVQLRTYAYLYTAQRDASFLSYNTHDCFIGSLDPLSLKIINLINPDFVPSFDCESDDYSKEITQAIFSKYETRFNEEEENSHTYPEWGENKDQPTAKWKPWVLSVSEYHLQSPPPAEDSKAWAKQLKELKKARRYLNENEILSVIVWDQENDQRSKDWRVIANDCLAENVTPIGKALYVRSALMMGIYDATIAANNAKYTYLIPRPFTIDTGIVPLSHKPSSPSYPSGTATRAYAASTILSYFFSKECQDWQELAMKASKSRVWAGVHFPIDVEAGEILGKEVGNAVIEHLTEQH